MSLSIKGELVIYLKVLAAISLLGAIAWVVFEPGFEPSLAVVGSISALAALFVADRKKRGESSQAQVVSSKSVGIQAGGDINIGSFKQDK